MVIDRKKLSRLRVGSLILGKICEMNVTALLHEVFQEYMDKFLIIYLDDIVIWLSFSITVSS